MQDVMGLGIYGYVRVSSVDQNEDRQMLDMIELKIVVNEY